MNQASALTSGPKHHFFGYYGIPPWDAGNRYLLCLETAFQDHFPLASEPAVIGVVDDETKMFSPLAETRAWNFQQGCKLRWLPQAPEQRVIYNDREGARYVSIVLDVRSGARRVLPRAISELSHDGRTALCISFSRLRNHFPVIGYAGIPDPYAADPHPDSDGIYTMDVESGDANLIVSYDRVRGHHAERQAMDGCPLWISHATFNTDDTRFCFLSRYRPEGQTRWKTALFTVQPDGSDLRCLIDYGYISHLDWYDPQVLLAFANIKGRGDHYYLVNDVTGQDTIVGGDVLTRDGHCSFSRDRRWFLTDTYPNAEDKRALKLWNMQEERQVILGRFYSDPTLRGEIRCDLHPRWDRNDERVCFDSVHEGMRQVYVLDVSSVVKAR